MKTLLHKTKSICPVCSRQIPAVLVAKGEDIFLEKTCPDHSFFSTLVWRGHDIPYANWGGERPAEIPANCPNDCGLCPGHGQDTCCILVEITQRCNLNCRYCFADGGATLKQEPTVAELAETFRTLVGRGLTFLQLSGGEPTLRDDLPQIVAAAKDAGATSIQLNTNGLRLAREPEFTRALAEAGLTFVFLQFDSTRPEATEFLRGADLLTAKQEAIRICGELGLGVTLVPTLVPGVNTDDIGALIRYGLSLSPVVRGVHFQPVSYFGRCPYTPKDADRYTLPQLVQAVEDQTGGLVTRRDLAPSCCDHPRCGFHGDFIVLPDGLLSLTPRERTSCCKTTALQNRAYIARRWKRDLAGEAVFSGQEETLDMNDLTTFLTRGRTHVFTLTAMAFQDRWNLDLERLNACSLHVYANGKTVPFCARYIGAESH